MSLILKKKIIFHFKVLPPFFTVKRNFGNKLWIFVLQMQDNIGQQNEE